MPDVTPIRRAERGLRITRRKIGDLLAVLERLGADIVDVAVAVAEAHFGGLAAPRGALCDFAAQAPKELGAGGCGLGFRKDGGEGALYILLKRLR